MIGNGAGARKSLGKRLILAKGAAVEFAIVAGAGVAHVHPVGQTTVSPTPIGVLSGKAMVVISIVCVFEPPSFTVILPTMFG
jgi:hypothetical protein